MLKCQNSSNNLFIDGDFNYDLGGSILDCDISVGNANDFKTGIFSNFTILQSNSAHALRIFNNTEVNRFSIFCTGTAKGIYTNGTNVNVSNFTVETNSGFCIDGVSSSGIFNNFRAKSVTGYCVYAVDSASNFYAETGDKKAVYMFLGKGISNFTAVNNSSSSETVLFQRSDNFSQGTMTNLGSGSACVIQRTNSSGNLNGSHLKFYSVGGIALKLTNTFASGMVSISNSYAYSSWDNAGGHACQVTSATGDYEIINSTFKIENASANGLHSSVAVDVDAVNNVFINSTTAINANVTVNASTDLGNGNTSI